MPQSIGGLGRLSPEMVRLPVSVRERAWGTPAPGRSRCESLQRHYDRLAEGIESDLRGLGQIAGAELHDDVVLKAQV